MREFEWHALAQTRDGGDERKFTYRVLTSFSISFLVPFRFDVVTCNIYILLFHLKHFSSSNIVAFVLFSGYAFLIKIFIIFLGILKVANSFLFFTSLRPVTEFLLFIFTRSKNPFNTNSSFAPLSSSGKNGLLFQILFARSYRTTRVLSTKLEAKINELLDYCRQHNQTSLWNNQSKSALNWLLN